MLRCVLALPLGPALSVTARELLAKVGLSETGTEAEAIHDFRRAVKRWRAFLRLAEPIVGEKRGRFGTRPATSPAIWRVPATPRRRSMP